MKSYFHYPFIAIATLAFGSCAGSDSEDPSRPAPATHKTMTERLNEGGGYKQAEDGSWVPKSDKRSAYDSQRDSAYFKGKIEKETYKTGDYSKKSWWGSKDYAKKSYQGDTDGSRFQTAARQDGVAAIGQSETGQSCWAVRDKHSV